MWWIKICLRRWETLTYGNSALYIGGIAYRLLAFWDTESETLVVVAHGFVKKTQKTPKREIERADGIRKRYFDFKRKYNGENR